MSRLTIDTFTASRDYSAERALRALTVPVVPASSTPNPSAPFSNCTWTFDLPWTKIMPDTLQALGNAGAGRMMPSNAVATASLIAAASPPTASMYGSFKLPVLQAERPQAKTWDVELARSGLSIFVGRTMDASYVRLLGAVHRLTVRGRRYNLISCMVHAPPSRMKVSRQWQRNSALERRPRG